MFPFYKYCKCHTWKPFANIHELPSDFYQIQIQIQTQTQIQIQIQIQTQIQETESGLGTDKLM